jgi:hypothetical protein
MRTDDVAALANRLAGIELQLAIALDSLTTVSSALRAALARIEQLDAQLAARTAVLEARIDQLAPGNPQRLN